MISPHIVRGLSIDDYHRDPHFTSHSQIKDFIERGPRYFYTRNIARSTPRTETEAFRFGKAAELLVQDGETAYRDAVHALVGDGRTTEVKAAKAAALAAGKILISEEDERDIFAMRDVITADLPDAMNMIAQAESQVTLRGGLSELAVQSRPDWCSLDAFGPWTMDFKTVKVLDDLVVQTEQGFVGGPALVRLGYHTQAALAQHLMAACGFPGAAAYLLIAEKQVPYRAVCVDIGAFLGGALETLRRACTQLQRCYANNAFPRVLPPQGAPSGAAIPTLARPRWLERQERDEARRAEGQDAPGFTTASYYGDPWEEVERHETPGAWT